MISLICCTYRPGGIDLLARSFVGMADKDYELIVVDDCPGRVERGLVPKYLLEQGIKLRWYGKSKDKSYPEAKGGLCNAWNTALAFVTKPLTVWVSDYTILPPNWYDQWTRVVDMYPPRTLISGSAIMYDCPKPGIVGDIESNLDWSKACPRFPWVPREFETFYAMIPTPFWEAINGVDERADHCHCWPVSSKIAQAKILGYRLAIEPDVCCHMIDHRSWDSPAEKAPAGCGGEGLWRITHIQSVPEEPKWVVPSSNPFNLREVRYGPSRSFSEFVNYDFPPEHDALFREMLADDVRCRRSCQFQRDDNGAYQLKVPPSPLHWSRQCEWPWAVLNAELTGSEDCLDIGGGWACVKYAIARRCNTLLCIDTMDEAIEASRQTTGELGFKNIGSMKADARAIPFADNYFDRVFCLSVLEHIPGEHLTCVQEILRVLKPGGIALITLDVLFDGERSGHFYVTQEMAGQILGALGMGRPRNTCRNGADLEGMKLTVLMIKFVKPLEGL